MGAAAPRAVVFDLWNTIAEWPAEAWAEVRPSVAERVGLPLEEFDARWYGDLARVRALRLRLFDHPVHDLLPALRERLRHPLQLAAEDRFEPGSELRADVARAHGEAHDLAQHLHDLMPRELVRRRDQHPFLLRFVVPARGFAAR